MKNPYLLDRPAIISFSGGRTSGFMLRMILDAYNGTLPEDIKVLFCNTGKEREETLDFVQECSDQWNVPVTWVEYRYQPEEKRKHWFEIVDYKTASRNGEPFDQVIEARSMLPNPLLRYCTSELKVKTKFKFVKHHLGWTDGYSNAVGLRYDEPRRVAKAKAMKREYGEECCLPLHEAKVTEQDILDWWNRNDFDLQLMTHEGNCDLCFLKGAGKISAILEDRPGLAQWWISHEENAGGRDKVRNAGVALFRKDRPSYAGLLNLVTTQGRLPFPDDCSLDDCNCTD